MLNHFKKFHETINGDNKVEENPPEGLNDSCMSIDESKDEEITSKDSSIGSGSSQASSGKKRKLENYFDRAFTPVEQVKAERSVYRTCASCFFSLPTGPSPTQAS
jgi:hypothetical protein